MHNQLATLSRFDWYSSLILFEVYCHTSRAQSSADAMKSFYLEYIKFYVLWTLLSMNWIFWNLYLFVFLYFCIVSRFLHSFTIDCWWHIFNICILPVNCCQLNDCICVVGIVAGLFEPLYHLCFDIFVSFPQCGLNSVVRSYCNWEYIESDSITYIDDCRWPNSIKAKPQAHVQVDKQKMSHK